MDLGRGFLVPREKGAMMMQNGDIWIPATPQKPILQMSNYVPQPEVMPQNDQMAGLGDWQDLLGLYSGVLQGDPSNGLPPPPKSNVNNLVSPNQIEHNMRLQQQQQNFNPNGLVGRFNPGLQNSRDVAPVVETYNGHFRDFNAPGPVGVSPRVCSGSNQKAGPTGSSMQNLGEVVRPRRVDSLAELMGMKGVTHAPTSNGVPVRSINVMDKPPTIICPNSQGESNVRDYTSFGVMPQRDHVVHANRDINGYNLPETPNGRVSPPYWANYNLNLPPRPEAGESSSTSRPFPVGSVTPAQQKQSKNHQIVQVPHLLIDEMSTPEKYTQDNIISPPQPEILEKDHNELLRNISDGGNGGIDLNKTPHQKTPKRKKHRPKVVVEGKSKKTPKPAAEKSNTPPNGTPTPKRKYVRKNGVKPSSNPSNDPTENVAEQSNAEPRTKSCKRALNFDLDNGAVTEGRAREFNNNGRNKRPFNLNLNLDSQNAEWPTELNSPSTYVVSEGQQNTYGKEKQQAEIPYNFVQSANRGDPQESLQLVTTTPPPTYKDRALNIIARSMYMRNASLQKGGGFSQLVSQGNTREPNLHSRRQPVQILPQPREDLVDVTEKQGREQQVQAELSQRQIIDLMGSGLWSRGVPETSHSNSGSCRIWQNGYENSLKTKVVDKFHGISSNIPSGITNADSSGRTESRRDMSFPAQSSVVYQNGGLTNSHSRGQSTSGNSNNKSDVTCDWYLNSQDPRNKFLQQLTSSQGPSRAEQMAPMTYHQISKEQIINSITTVTNWNPESAPKRGRPKSIPTNETLNSPDRVAVKKRTAGQTSSKKVSIMDKNPQQDTDNVRSNGHATENGSGSQNKIILFPVDYLTDRMNDLHLKCNGKEIVQREQNALVPFRSDGAIVPYEEFSPVKKRKPRPRVDLDPETNRLWNLLMGKEGSESAEPMDNDKQKWWEDERKVFRGRVDSFIARMHLVQGDRRFSKWKGSVVDSVIGVFLTQNVSDHLSSSAFMSLAAKFPLKSRTMSPSAEQHEVRITFPDEPTPCDHKRTTESVYNGSSLISKEASKHDEGNEMRGMRTFLRNDSLKGAEEDVISSQSSSESLIFQASEDIKSSSGSNSEFEDVWSFSKNQNHQSTSKQAERIAALQQFQQQLMRNSLPNRRPLSGHQQLENPVYRQNLGPASISNAYSHPFLTSTPLYQSSIPPSTSSHTNMSMGLEEWEADILAFSGKESISSLVSTVDNIGLSAAESSCIERPNFQPSTRNYTIPSNYVDLQANLPDGSQSSSGQQFIRQRQGRRQETFQKESTFVTTPARCPEVFGKQPSGNAQKYPNEDIIADTRKQTEMGKSHSSVMGKEHSSEMGKEHFSGKPASKTSTTNPNERKRKAEKEKVEPFNWDTLRMQAQSTAGIREKTKEAMDSLDYETLRNADVSEISDTIKERGMNNMLAERMKDFLNRLVRDHERVDLEWLRDVQPDKAKDYLLSIRGLGLKSVECIRLLTLHHLAFPVDTNVGRIAVRLGWVPLQPLPESLQLHLLEMYPVLDSIQKYLWPRLCNLDQETLYELHYQMITFGKVFCTKREPNCNACPMRAECRHFASAFASARLALPGPNEKRIVTSAAPASADKNCDFVIKPIRLLPAEDNLEREKVLKENYEPLVEEPTTPEAPIDVSERNIEDVYYEDPDEIPVINLSVEEFTTNLQSFMQGHMEMGEDDMSKALVALGPGLASIPTPKLKHVSRLRTEHQVYELPDGHPLLKEMDRREPDDPTPYLLAIWTPGETADSVQPPENTCACGSQEGGDLCNKSTCFACNNAREAQAQTVRGTILIPCRTAMRGSFPLNGTYFQVNEVFADHESSLNPIDVPRSLVWNLPRRTVFFGTSVTSIFKGLSTEDIQFCFWKGFVCVRGFEQKTRAPRPLKARLHLPASKMVKQNEQR